MTHAAFTQPEIAPWRSSRGATLLLQGSVYLFPIVAVVSSIPVFSIVIKYNLVENGMSPRLGFLWGVVFPWVVAFPLVYMPDVLAQIINLSSLVFVSFTDFVVPFSLYVILQRRKARAIASGDGLASAAPPLLQSHRVSAPPATATTTSAPWFSHSSREGRRLRRRGSADAESGMASTAQLEAVVPPRIPHIVGMLRVCVGPAPEDRAFGGTRWHARATVGDRDLSYDCAGLVFFRRGLVRGRMMLSGFLIAASAAARGYALSYVVT